jgi:TRAP transporter TAXI family solute receptor
MKKYSLWVSLVAMLFVINTNGTSQSAELEKLVFAGGPAGGNWYGMAGSINALIKTKFPSLLVNAMPGGAVGNATLVDKGRAQLGFSVGHLYGAASEGNKPFKYIHKNIRALAEVGISDMGVFLVTEKTPINSIRELKEKKYPLRLTTSPKASSPALAAARILKEYGITYDDLKAWGGSVTFTTYTDSASLIADGHADSIISAAGPAIFELISRMAMKSFPIDEDIVEILVKKYGYAKNFVPKGRYPWVKEDSWTIGSPNIILVGAEIPEEVVYKITKVICENPKVIRNWGAHHAYFNPKTAWKNVGGPLHPGAERYYREAGYMK